MPHGKRISCAGRKHGISPESAPYRNAGYVSDVFPKENGDYAEPTIRFGPTLTLEFGKNITFGELEVDIGSTSQLTAFKISGERKTSPESAELPIYETVFSKDKVPVIWENGKFFFRENFDRIARINLTCISNGKQQRGRIKRVKNQLRYAIFFRSIRYYRKRKKASCWLDAAKQH